MHAKAISRGSKLAVEYYAHPYFIVIVKTEYWSRWLCRVWNRRGITPGVGTRPRRRDSDLPCAGGSSRLVDGRWLL